MFSFQDILSFFNGQPFPDTKAINATGPTAADGTEYSAELLDHFLGLMQALLVVAGLFISSANNWHLYDECSGSKLIFSQSRISQSSIRRWCAGSK